jgi:hypothetical protein
MSLYDDSEKLGYIRSLVDNHGLPGAAAELGLSQSAIESVLREKATSEARIVAYDRAAAHFRCAVVYPLNRKVLGEIPPVKISLEQAAAEFVVHAEAAWTQRHKPQAPRTSDIQLIAEEAISGVLKEKAAAESAARDKSMLDDEIARLGVARSLKVLASHTFNPFELP